MKPILADAGNALDPQGLAALKRAAAKEGKPSDATLKQVAQQFEALFLQMTLKSMREASFGDDLFESDQGNFYRDMHDQQLALTLAKSQGIGLTDVLVRQLGGGRASAKSTSSPAQAMLDNTRLRLRQQIEGASSAPDPKTFVQTLGSAVQQAASQLGVAPEAVLSVAALETGWGSTVMRRPDGTSANNYFGIKAGSDWSGERVTAITREYVDGRPVMRTEQFRAYSSAAESVADFACFLKGNPHYKDALNQKDPKAFVAALAAGGYATDPAYAHKATAIASGDALRAALESLKNSGDAPIPA